MEQDIFDGTCPECAGDNIETVKDIIVGGKVRSQEKKCLECGISFTVSRKVVIVAEYEPIKGGEIKEK